MGNQSDRLHNRSKGSLESARSMYEQATMTDPSCVAAYIGYARTWVQLIVDGWEPASVGWPAVMDSMTELLQSDPFCADAMAFQGLGESVFLWNHKASESTFNKALKIAPRGGLVNRLAGRASLFQAWVSGRSTISGRHCRTSLWTRVQ